MRMVHCAIVKSMDVELWSDDRIYLCIQSVDPFDHNGVLTLLNVVLGQFVVTGLHFSVESWIF